MKNYYWMNELNDIFSFNNFLKDINSSKIFDRIKYVFSNDMGDLEKFLTDNNISFFEFYTGIISMYLSRTSNSERVIFLISISILMILFLKSNMAVKKPVFDFIFSVKK